MSESVTCLFVFYEWDNLLIYVCLFTGTDGNLARREFLNYALSLMRSHNDEHADSLPSLDISSMRHVAYVFDALIYYIRSSIDMDAEVFR